MYMEREHIEPHPRYQLHLQCVNSYLLHLCGCGVTSASVKLHRKCREKQTLGVVPRQRYPFFLFCFISLLLCRSSPSCACFNSLIYDGCQVRRATEARDQWQSPVTLRLLQFDALFHVYADSGFCQFDL